MSGTKISLLSAVVSLAGTEETPLVQGGSTKKATVNQIKSYVLTGGLSTILAVSNDAGAYKLKFSGLTANRAVYLDANKEVAVSSASNTELGYLAGVTSAIQNQINNILSGTTKHTGFQLDGSGYVGGTGTPTSYMDFAAAIATKASLRILPGVAVTSPNDGEIWYDGTDLKFRNGGTTKIFQLL